VFKRGQGVVGAFHASDIPEFYGSSVSPDFIGTDALGMFPNLSYYQCGLTYHGYYYYSVNFANTGNPAIPHNSKSLLSNVDWRPWGSSAQHPLLTFLSPAPNVSITFDTFRASAMNLLNNITLGLASASAS
jgi:acetylcholinesterase